MDSYCYIIQLSIILSVIIRLYVIGFEEVACLFFKLHRTTPPCGYRYRGAWSLDG